MDITELEANEQENWDQGFFLSLCVSESVCSQLSAVVSLCQKSGSDVSAVHSPTGTSHLLQPSTTPPPAGAASDDHSSPTFLESHLLTRRSSLIILSELIIAI